MRKNKNRGFKQLRVWRQSVDLYKFLYDNLKELPYEINKSKSNTLDACHSIQRNIAEGYCRKSVKEYLNFLNYSLASCGELNSSIITFHNAKLLSDSFFEKFDARLFELENGLLKLAVSLQNKIKDKNWDESYE